MAAPSAQKVIVGLTGGVYRDPTGTASLPTNATSTLAAEFEQVGYLTDDGLTLNWFDESTNDIRAWQDNALVRRVVTEVNSTVTFTALEINDEVLKAFYGDANVSAGTTRVTTEPGVRSPWVIDVRDGTKRKRVVIFDGQVTDRAEIPVQNGAAMTHGFTLTCYPKADNDQQLAAVIYDVDTSASS